MVEALGVIAFVVALLLSIMLHEAGHFVTAKRFGMKATQFFLGFGPTVWSFRRGETEYGVKAIPAGGFVKIVGMTQLEEVDEADEPRAFYRQPAPQRAVVLGAGSFMHFVIGFVLFVIVLSVVGTSRSTTTVSEVSACIPKTESAACTSTDPVAPARASGLQVGDRIVAFQGKPVTDWLTFAKEVRAHGAGPVTLTVERDGQRITKRVDLVSAKRPSIDDPTKLQTFGVLGIGPKLVTHRLGPIAGLQRAGSGFGQSVVATFKALGDIPAAVPQLWRSTVDGTQRNPNGLVGPVGIGRVSGQLAAGNEPVTDKIGNFLILIAGLNIFVGIFNLLPLLPLDGGHLAVLGFEQARTRIYRVIGRRDPGRVDLNKLLPAAYLVVALFIGLSMLLLLSDIVAPIKNPFTG